MFQNLKIYYQEHPLRVILIAGLFFRLLAVIFSKGFGWIDDQFLVIEIAQSWVDGIDFYHWLPDASGNNKPAGFSFFYTGIHYLLFTFFEWLGITGPQAKMYLIRLLHALWSLLIIKYGYQITFHFSNRKTANLAGWLLALFWIFPFISVRNLVEFVCIPLIMYGTLLVVKSDKKTPFIIWLWVGFLFGLAFNIRFQTFLLSGGIGLVLLMQKKWKETIFIGIGIFAAIIIFQGGIDYLIWKKPFAQLLAYVNYNLNHSQEYTSGPWYHYIIFLLAALIPPVSIFLLAGYLRSYKNLMIIFLPVLIFIVFHSWYPNKQERFIATVLPFIIISGVVGWEQIKDGMLNPSFMKKWIRGSWIFFWIVNMIALMAISTMYSKKARVESMSYLGNYPELEYFIIEDENKDVLRFPPQFYLNKWIYYDAFMASEDFADFKKRKDWTVLANQPGFILFFEPDNIERRVERMKTIFPEIVHETTIHPGLMDKLLHWLNPINDNQNIYIYRNKAVIGDGR